MTAFVIAVLSIAVIGIAFTAVSIFAARRLVAARTPQYVPFEVCEGNAIRLPSTPHTTLPGEYGLFYDGGRGHARVGSILDGRVEQGFVLRALGSVTGAAIPSRGEGTWGRVVYPTPAAMGLAFEDVEIVSDAGASPAWIVPPRDMAFSGVWAIHLHGIRTTRPVVLPGVSAIRDLGITSLIVSWRGDTEGPPTPAGRSLLGQEEWLDVEEALAFAISSGAQSVILVGWSMGGMIARLVHERSRFRQHILGLVLVSPVTSWRSVVKHAVRAAHLPPPTAWGVEMTLGHRVLSKLIGLSTPICLAALESEVVGGAGIPTLVLHNPGDDVVPFSAVAAYASRNAETELVVFGESPHAMEWNIEPERFEETIRSWVSALLENGRRQRGRT